MIKIRNIKTVIEQIKPIFPDDIDISELDSIIESSLFTAPEAMNIQWQLLCEWLEDTLGTPDTEWKIQINNIVQEKSEISYILKYELFNDEMFDTADWYDHEITFDILSKLKEDIKGYKNYYGKRIRNIKIFKVSPMEDD